MSLAIFLKFYIPSILKIRSISKTYIKYSSEKNRTEQFKQYLNWRKLDKRSYSLWEILPSLAKTLKVNYVNIISYRRPDIIFQQHILLKKNIFICFFNNSNKPIIWLYSKIGSAMFDARSERLCLKYLHRYSRQRYRN